MKICTICKQPKEVVRSAVKDGVYVKNICDNCSRSFSGHADGSAAFARSWDVREHAVDLIQPWEKEEFIKHYPDKAWEAGYTEEDFRKYG